MKSPFPGMDPYLERHWLDVHARLVTYVADQLNEKLPRALFATTEERIAIDSEELERPFGAAPDVRVIQPGVSDAGATGIAYRAPLKLVIELDSVTEHFIRIVEPGHEKLITVIEVISPTNKTGAGLKEFSTKRAELIKSGVHFVEIDLVRKGNWRGLLRPHVCPRKAITEFRVTVRLGGDRPTAYLYPAPLRDALPSVLIPLRKGDAEVSLDLQPLVDLVYTRGRYLDRLNYREPLEPALSDEDQKWADELLVAAHR